MLKLNIPNLEAIRNWCNEKFQPKGNYITKSEIGNEVNETEITLSDLSETVPEAISAMSEEKKLKNLLSHIKAFMTGSKALIDLCVTTGMITQQNINDENKIPSAALLYSLNDALNGQVAQINSNLTTYLYELNFDTPYTIRTSWCNKNGRIISLGMIIGNGGKLFPRTRIEIGCIPEHIRPIHNTSSICRATSSIDWYSDRITAFAVRKDGSMYVDNFFHDDIKEFYLNIMYLVK